MKMSKYLRNWHLTLCAFSGDSIDKLVTVFKRSQRLHDKMRIGLSKREETNKNKTLEK